MYRASLFYGFFKKNVNGYELFYSSGQREKIINTLLHDYEEEFVFQVRRRDGEILWVHITARIYPEHGYFLGFGRDITIQKELTRTELKVLSYLMQGMTNKLIAQKIHKSVRTIEDHRANIMRKLNVSNIVKLTEKIIRYGVLLDNSSQ